MISLETMIAIFALIFFALSFGIGYWIEMREDDGLDEVINANNKAFMDKVEQYGEEVK